MQMDAMAAIGGILLAGFLCQWLSWRDKRACFRDTPADAAP